MNASVAGRNLVGLAAALGLLGGAAVLLGPVAARPASRHRAASAPAFAQDSGARRGRPAVPATAMQLGSRLMVQAASACATTEFSGEQSVRWWGPAGVTTDVIEVWHQPGGQLMTGRPADAPRSTPAGLAAADQDAMGITEQQLALLQDNFVTIYAGRGTADGRPARIVQLWRPGGGLAAIFWLDDATGLPLRRQLFGTEGGLVSDTEFTSLQVGGLRSSAQPEPAGGGDPGLNQPEHSLIPLGWSQVAALRSAGWPLPRLLAGSLILVAAHQMPSAQGRVVELTYSDGLSVISLFLQRGDLPDQLGDWHSASLAGRRLYVSDADDRILAWSAHGYVYSMIADAPRPTVARAVAGLPQDRAFGLFARIGRGLRRLVSWANPFR